MKRLLVCLLTVLMIFSSLSVCVFADTQPKLSVGNVETQPGKTILVPIKISNNTGIWGIEFNVKFDTNIFEVQEVVHNGEVFEKGDFMIGPADFSDGYVRFVISALNLLDDNNTNNGTVCYIKLKVSKQAQIYKYPFEIEETFACKVDTKVVEIATENGSVNIVESSSEQPIKVKDAEVIVKAKDNKVIDNYTNDLTVSDENTTDKNSETVTNKKGENETVEQTEKKDNDIENLDKENDNDIETIGSSESTTNNLVIVIVYICSALLLAGIIVLIIVLIKKNKK